MVTWLETSDSGSVQQEKDIYEYIIVFERNYIITQLLYVLQPYLIVEITTCELDNVFMGNVLTEPQPDIYFRGYNHSSFCLQLE